MSNYRNLEIWKRSVDLATEVYLLTNSFPNEEKFGLISQILISKNLGYSEMETANKIIIEIDEIQKMIYSFRNTLK